MRLCNPILILLLFACISCSSQISIPPGASVYISSLNRDMKPDVTEEVLSGIVDSNTKFAIDLYKNMTEKSDCNLVFSPYSISLLWGMVWEGAEDFTADEIAQSLNFNEHESIDVHRAFNKINLELEKLNRKKKLNLKLTNSVWVNINDVWQKDYLDILKTHYNSGIYGVDFANDSEGSRNLINKWIGEKTKGHFTEPIEYGMIDGLTTMILVNTLYFNCPWDCPFDPGETKDIDFTLLDGNKTSIPTMHQYNLPFRALEDEKYTAIELQFKENSGSMLIIMPSENEFENVESGLSPEFINYITDNSSRYKTELFLPKFEIRHKSKLKNDLKELGIKNAFDGMDFSGIKRGGGMWIEEFVHGSYILVNEAGTEAAASSVAIFEKCITEIIRIDHPFIFILRDNKTKSILFMGRVVDPNSLIW